MTKKRVLFLYNGGTIGLATEIRDGQPVLVSPKDANDFMKVCDPIIKKLKEKVDIRFEIITTKDSSDMQIELRVKTTEKLNDILTEVRSILKDKLKRHELLMVLKEHKYTYFPECMFKKTS